MRSSIICINRKTRNYENQIQFILLKRNNKYLQMLWLKSSNESNAMIVDSNLRRLIGMK